MIEENLRRAMIISHGDPTVFVTGRSVQPS